jgi:hypothetical protein
MCEGKLCGDETNACGVVEMFVNNKHITCDGETNYGGIFNGMKGKIRLASEESRKWGEFLRWLVHSGYRL